MVALLYALFLASGAAGLVYEVTWVRSLTLVFGGSHLAVTTVLSVYMGGLALGGAALGRRADASPSPLRLYGLLEIGVAAFALVFLGMMQVYPALYGPLARLAEENRLWLSLLRVAFGVAALIVPTTLMGGTLPVLSRFVAGRTGSLGRQLSFLYGFNTLGAVLGALAAGFALLPALGVRATLLVAAATNLSVGLAAVGLARTPWARAAPAAMAASPNAGASPRSASPPAAGEAGLPDVARHLVLWGTAVGGFCALGYEVLWTRMLTMVLGTSVYSFTIMLVAFLAGIAIGSQAYGIAERRRRGPPGGRSVAAFGLVELATGVAALAVTVLMRDLPTHATLLQRLFFDSRSGEFGARQAASFAVAFAYMFVPAFLMGVAFPLAGTLHATRGEGIGGAVGRVFTWNTVGAILGAAASGFGLIYAFGIERSLQMLAGLNAGAGLALAVSLAGRAVPAAAAAATAALLVALGGSTSWGRFWDMKYFAVFRNNQREAFDTAFKLEDALRNTDVLYYFEGVNETISVIQPKGSMRAFVVNARPEASTAPMDVQCQRTLGHLPMLLHPNPRRVFVLGTGTGMTLGATALHPEAVRIVLAEIEPGAIGAARAFADYNHGAVDSPKVRIVFDDGRNHLRTTDERFDVVTADPIHPWSGGAAYLYTREYFRSVAAHLAPGGIAAQWLPIYELAPRDIQTVLRTWAEAFPHVMVWLTHYDAELVGSNQAIVVDEEALARRIARPEIARDLAPVEMGTAEAFLSYFVMSTERARELGRGGDLNTDDNLTLEFSAPASQGVGWLMGANAATLATARESLLPYLAPAGDPEERARQASRWERNLAAARAYDPAHAFFLWGRGGEEEFARLMRLLAAEHPEYAPYRFLRREVERAEASVPRLAGAARFPVEIAGRRERTLVVSAVTVRAGETRAAVMLVDNDRREILGQRYLDGSGEELDLASRKLAAEGLGLLGQAYGELAAEARRGGGGPSEAAVTARFKERLAAWAVAP